MPWSSRFLHPVVLKDGREINTLEEAASYVLSLSKAAQKRPEWQLAGRILMDAAEGRDFPMHAEVAFRKAVGGW